MIKFKMNKLKSRLANHCLFATEYKRGREWDIWKNLQLFCIYVRPSLAEFIPTSGTDPVYYLTKYMSETFKMSPVTGNEIVEII